MRVEIAGAGGVVSRSSGQAWQETSKAPRSCPVCGILGDNRSQARSFGILVVRTNRYQGIWAQPDRDRMTHRLRLVSVLLLLALQLFWTTGAFAQVPMPGAPEDPIAILDAEAGKLERIIREADVLERAQRVGQGAVAADDTAAPALRDRAMAVETQSTEAVARLQPQLQAIDARIAQLGEASDDEAEDVKAQRQRLADERAALDSAIKRGRLLAGDARQAADRMILAITEAFNRSTFQKVSSPLTPSFWSDLARSSADDHARVMDFLGDAMANLWRGLSVASGLAIASTGLAVALILLLPVRRKLRLLGRRVAIEQVPGSRARRSGLAIWFVIVGTLASTLAFVSIFLSLRWSSVLSYDAQTLLERMTIAACFGSFVVSLGAGLLLVGQSSWRLLPIDDAAAKKLRSYPPLVAVVTFLGVTVVEAGKVTGVSQPATILTNYALSIVYVSVIVSVLISLGRLRRSDPEAAEREPNMRTTLLTIATILVWLSVAVSVVAMIQGYVNLSLVLGRQTIWSVIVVASAYLLLVVVDDLATTLLSAESRIGRSLHAGLGIRKGQVSQLGVILSAILRLCILFVALAMLTAPFGPGATSIFYQTGNLSELTIGGVTLLSGSVIKAALALAIGIALMRLLRHWLTESYLPTTDLDPGARNSVVTIVSYGGIILAGFWSITALGIGVERIALVVSALSVGIGFGLQAITQNFISGLILLAERPVKIGDTVRIGTDEGDVKRISVRSTEIQIADRSTLIVPNSELITKTIRNMTLADPLGRVQISFSAPLDVDTAAVRTALLDLYKAHPAVLDDPLPSVFIDGIVGGQIAFNSFAFVASPRQVYSTRSALLFDVLERFRRDGIVLVAPPA